MALAHLFYDTALDPALAPVGADVRRQNVRRENVRCLPARMATEIILAADTAAAAIALALARANGTGVLLVILSTALLAAQGHYRPRIELSLYRQAPAAVGTVCTASVVAGLTGSLDAARVARLAMVYGVALVAMRLFAYAWIRGLRRRRRLAEATLVLGAGALGSQVGWTLSEHPEYGLDVVGYLDGFEDGSLPAPVLGRIDQLDRVLTASGVQRVIIAFGATRDLDLVPVVRACDRRRVELHVVPRLFELGVPTQGPDTDCVWGVPLQNLRRSYFQRRAHLIKRAFDVALALPTLLLLSPVMLVLALATKLSDGGPILFHQTRIGQDGRPIEILKFRTMRKLPDSDMRWTAERQALTRLGGLMRRTSLDELPQLLNVLRGDMSLVGPRPERPFFVSRFEDEVPRYSDRHRVPVGMTGWAQVHGLRGDTSIDDRARFDNQYIEHWSLWRDIAILFLTIHSVLRDAASRSIGGGSGPRARSVRTMSSPGASIGACPQMPAVKTTTAWTRPAGRRRRFLHQ